VTLQVALKESAEHLVGMSECRAAMEGKKLKIEAYALGDESNKNCCCKVVHFVRHGQGFHNLLADIYTQSGVKWSNHVASASNPYAQIEVLDAPLTHKGRLQAAQLSDQVQRLKSLHGPLELVVSSPNCRALMTAVVAFDSCNGSKDCKWLVHEMVREEHGVHLCDQRRPKSQQAREFSMFDFTLLESENDALFNPTRRESKLEVGERVYKFMEWLSERPEKHVAITSHSAWLMTLFNGVVDCKDNESLKSWFQTGEMRSVKLKFKR